MISSTTESRGLAQVELPERGGRQDERLTSVDLNLPGLGRAAAELLLRMISRQPVEPGTHLVPSTVVKRGSTELI